MTIRQKNIMTMSVTDGWTDWSEIQVGQVPTAKKKRHSHCDMPVAILVSK